RRRAGPTPCLRAAAPRSQGTGLERADLDLPVVAVDALRLDGEVRSSSLAELPELDRRRDVRRAAVDAQLGDAVALRELERLGVRERELGDLDALRAHSPEVALLPRGGRLVRRRDVLLDRVGE